MDVFEAHLIRLGGDAFFASTGSSSLPDSEPAATELFGLTTHTRERKGESTRRVEQAAGQAARRLSDPQTTGLASFFLPISLNDPLSVIQPHGRRRRLLCLSIGGSRHFPLPPSPASP